MVLSTKYHGCKLYFFPNVKTTFLSYSAIRYSSANNVAPYLTPNRANQNRIRPRIVNPLIRPSDSLISKQHQLPQRNRHEQWQVLKAVSKHNELPSAPVNITRSLILLLFVRVFLKRIVRLIKE